MKKLLFLLTIFSLCTFNVDAQKKVPHHQRTYPTTPAASRNEIILPQVKGYNCYKADFHVHTHYSDGQVSPAGRAYEAWYDGLDILAITDHYEYQKGVKLSFEVTAPYNPEGVPTTYKKASEANGIKTDFNAIHNEAEKYVKSKGWNMLLVKGCEMARPKLGHYNALFLTDINAIYNKDLEVAFRNAKKQGGIIMHNHPGNVTKYETEWHKSVYDEGLIDAVEVANGYNIYPYMMNRCLDKGLAILSGTDAHGVASYPYASVGNLRTMTIVLAKNLTEKAVKDAILKQRTIVYSGGDLIGDEMWLAELMNAAIDCRIVGEDEESRSYILTNNSSLTFSLGTKGKYVRQIGPFMSHNVTIKKGKNGKHPNPKYSVGNMWVKDYKNPKITLEIDK